MRRKIKSRVSVNVVVYHLAKMAYEFRDHNNNISMVSTEMHVIAFFYHNQATNEM